MAAVLTPWLLLLLFRSITAHPGTEEPRDSGGPEISKLYMEAPLDNDESSTSGAPNDEENANAERCKSPRADGSPLTLSPSRQWYDRGQKVRVTCSEGYQPSTSQIECGQKDQGPASEWDVAPTCIRAEEKEGGSSFSAFNAIQVAQIVILLLSVTVTSLLCKRGTFQSTTPDSPEYVNTSMAS
ncbi:hypothetical protein NDU88_006829 [Pleurodeles waltl]|uniref:Sushi domain-containing protein n=1 Tax=Pleurodeles waltl TaxID=8319 RepID=A0AAV7WEI9_PLEWA|nr:hypothetical protein NDU88_006829 [Pleurodeles waltl]